MANWRLPGAAAGITADPKDFVLLSRQVVWDAERGAQRVGDGVTPGGVPIGLFAASRSHLKAFRAGGARLIEAGREGNFVWDAMVPVATHQGDAYEALYVAPDDGADGAWRRVHDGMVKPSWAGCVANSDAAAASNTARINAILEMIRDGLAPASLVIDGMYTIAPQSSGGVGLTIFSNVVIAGGEAGSGLKLPANAGNYTALIDIVGVAGTAQNVRIAGLTIDEQAAANTTADVTPGVAAKCLMAIRCYAGIQRDITIDGVTFKNTPGVNTIALNSDDNRGARVINCNFYFALAATTQPNAYYDNSAIYINGNGGEVANNHFYGVVGKANSAWEVHGFAFTIEGNKSYNYQINGNLVTKTSAPEITRSTLRDNIAINCMIGWTLWALTGHSLSDVEIVGNKAYIDPSLYPASINLMGGVTLISTTGVLGRWERIQIHHNHIEFKPGNYGATNPNNSSAGISLDLASGGVMSDIDVDDNTIVNAPNIGVGVYARVGSANAYRIRVRRNKTIDAGNNTGGTLRGHHYWRGTVFDGEITDNEMIDTGVGALVGSVGVSTILMTGGSVIAGRNTQKMSNALGSGGIPTNLVNRHAAFVTDVAVFAVVPATPVIPLWHGANVFTIEFAAPATVAMSFQSGSAMIVGKERTIKIVVKNASGGVVTLNMPAAIKFDKATAWATPANGDTTILTLATRDGGTTWHEENRMTVTH